MTPQERTALLALYKGSFDYRWGSQHRSDRKFCVAKMLNRFTPKMDEVLATARGAMHQHFRFAHLPEAPRIRIEWDTSRTRGFNGVPDPSLPGVVMSDLVGADADNSGGQLIAHELLHLFDSYLLKPEDEAELTARVCDHTPAHTWQGQHEACLMEAFAEIGSYALTTYKAPVQVAYDHQPTEANRAVVLEVLEKAAALIP